MVDHRVNYELQRILKEVIMASCHLL